MNDFYRFIIKGFKVFLLFFSLSGCTTNSGEKHDFSDFTGHIKKGLSQSINSFCSKSSESSYSNQEFIGIKKGFCIKQNSEDDGSFHIFGINDHELKKLRTVLIQIIPFYIFKH